MPSKSGVLGLASSAADRSLGLRSPRERMINKIDVLSPLSRPRDWDFFLILILVLAITPVRAEPTILRILRCRTDTTAHLQEVECLLLHRGIDGVIVNEERLDNLSRLQGLT